MSRVAYVDGRYRPHREAAVHVEDRGYQFGDGVYEVLAVRGGRLVDQDAHLARLARSLGELRIARPIGDAALRIVLRETVRRNGVENGIVYIQVTRGVARRDHGFPTGINPVLVVTARRTRPLPAAFGQDGIGVITVPDIRWRRCDIKTVMLLANVLAKQRAREAGAFEAWQVDETGHVTEGTSTNAWIVTQDGAVVTRSADSSILNGITRQVLLELIRAEGCRLTERPFSVAEAEAAREAFLTSTTAELLPVVRIDDRMVGDGVPGPLSRRLRELYRRHAGSAA